MKKALMFLIILFTAGSVFGSDYKIAVKVNYFNPSEKIFDEVYGSGLIYGIKAEKSNVFKKFGLIVETGYFEKQGELTFTKEDTTVKIIFLGPGVITHYSKGIFDFYAGGGLRYYHFEEKNPIGNTQQQGLGYFISLGTYIHLMKNFYADLGLNYSACQIQPEDLRVEIGGLEAGIGLAYEF